MLREKHSHATTESAPLVRKLAETRQAFEDFAYTVAHDLNAPLRSIINFSQLLENKCHDGKIDEKALHYIDVIVENSRKAQDRLASLLQYSRLNTVPLKIGKVECGDIVGHCLKQLKADIEECEALITVGSLPAVTADGDQLALLFYCLLSNAIKFSSQHPRIEITARRGHEAWVFSIVDHGIGIALKDHKVVFDVFRRLNSDEEYSGTGMGLALAYRIAELHGGLLWVESCLEEGASFYFTIPDILSPESIV